MVWIGSDRDLTSSAEAVRCLVEDLNITLLLGIHGSRQMEGQAEIAHELNATMVGGSASVLSVFQDRPSVFGLRPAANTRFRPTFELLNNSSSWASRPTMTTATRPTTVAYWYSGTDWRQGVCEGRIHFHPISISSTDTFIQTRFHPMTLSSKNGFIQ